MSPSNIVRRTARIALTSLAFLPIVVVALTGLGLIAYSRLTDFSILALLPAAGLATLGKSLGGDHCAMLFGGIGALGWSGLIACALYKLAQIITAEDFAWSEFPGGMLLGFIPGALIGWRVWIWHYQALTLAGCLVIGGLLGGFALAVYLGGVWSKAKYE